MKSKLDEAYLMLKKYEETGKVDFLDNFIYFINNGFFNEIILDNIAFLFYKDSKGKKVLDYIIDNSKITIDTNNQEKNKLTNIKNTCKNLLVNMPEKLLIQSYDNKKLIEYLLDENIPFLSRNNKFKNTEILDSLLNRKEYELMWLKTNIEDLLKNKDADNTYLDCILENQNKGKHKVYYANKKIDDPLLSKIIVICAKYNKISYIKNLTPQVLIAENKNGIRLIDEMLKIDEEVTMKKIVPLYLDDLEFYIYLKMKKENLSQFKFELGNTQGALNYIEHKFKEKESIHFDLETETLLKKFKEVMLCDNKSNEEMIDKVVASYREAISINKESIIELQHLIAIKQNVPEFSIQKNIIGKSFYLPEEKIVFLKELVDSRVIQHELGHSLYHLLTDVNVPNEYIDLVKTISTSPEFLNQAKLHAQTCTEFRKKARTEAGNTLQDSEHLNELFGFMKENLNASKEWIINYFEELGYKSSEIQKAFDSGVPSYDECVLQELTTQTRMLGSSILSEEYSELKSISDIIDAVYMGKYFDSDLKDEDGKTIKAPFGHGKKYYEKRGISACFDETIANYSSLLKSKNSKQAIKALRSIMGNEFVDFLEKYYNNEIRNSKKYQEKETRHL